MTSRNMGLVSKVLAVSVVTSLLTIPQWAQATTKSTIVDDLDTRKQEVIRQLERYHESKAVALQKLKSSTSIKSTTQGLSTTSTEASFSGKINVYRVAEYVFEVTTGGTVQVNNNLNANAIEYILGSVDTNGEISFYQSGDQLAPGKYFLDVISEVPTDLDYNIQLTGVTFSNLDTTLPTLNIEQPSVYEQRLAMGTTQLHLQGSSNGNVVEYAFNGLDYQPLPQTFSKDFTLRSGVNNLKVNAYELSGNAVYDDLTQTLPVVKRLGGATRYDVSARISRESIENTSTIVIARGDNFADALAGVPLASLEGAPILLTKTGFLSPEIKPEIERLKPQKAIILGGASVVSETVAQELDRMGITVTRIAGVDRYQGSAKVAETLTGKLQSQTPDAAFIVSGLNFPDALAASSVAGMNNMPILLVKTDSIPTDIANFIAKHPEIKKYYIVGGASVVSDNVKNKITTTYKKTVERIAGQNRYQTATEVARAFALDSKIQVFARGDQFPDALSGGPFAASLGAPIILTPPTALEAHSSKYLTEHKPNVVYILGDEGAVSKTVEDQLTGYVK